MRRQLFLSTILTSLMATGAMAQTAAPEGGENLLGEVVITATRQADTVNRVPLSVTAVTQQGLDRQSVRSVVDLARTVPAVTIQTANGVGDRVPNIAVRGISSSIGSATTGIYIDDTPLQKRNAIGLSGGGTPIPQLFDLERVEVLKGPQGTLYGGSSQGGTIRFITPTPSLTTYSGFARGEIATTKGGALTYEGGIAVGGPIIQDKIGFRASIVSRRSGGWIDHVDRFTGKTLEEDTNSRLQQSFRVAIAFQVTDRLRITPAIYGSKDDSRDSDFYWENIPAFSVPGRTGANGFVQPTFNYGPYNMYGPGKTGLNCNVGDQFAGSVAQCVGKQPRGQSLFTPSLTLDYDFDNMTVKSITSYLNDRTKGIADYSYLEPGTPQGGGPFVANFPLYKSNPYYKNTRYGLVEELRFASKPDGSKLNWVAGLYYSNFRTHSPYYIVAPGFNDLQARITGSPLPSALEPGGVSYHRDQRMWENDLAGFGEAGYMLTEKLKVIAGVRITRTQFRYEQNTAGALAGFLVPTIANGGLTQGDRTESPVTPKFGLQYQIDNRNMVYATAAKGFRSGGVNQPPPAARCAADLTSLGITSTPSTYASDTLWSYEAGAKVRVLGGRAQINTAAFYIDWKNVQSNFGLPTCGFGYTVNAGSAVSKGVDMQASVLVFEGLTASLQGAYTDAKYTQAVVGPAPRNTLFIANGDRLATPKWSLNLGLEYAFEVAGKFPAFVQANYQYSSSYQRSFGPGTGTYAPDTYMADATNFVTARAGVTVNHTEISAYVDNLFNSQDKLVESGGRGGCNIATGAACTTYAQYVYPFQGMTYRPRTFGLTATYRY